MTNANYGPSTDELPDGWSRRPITETLSPLANGKLVHQGKSPKCETHPAPDDSVWGVLKTTAIQPGQFLSDQNKELPATKEPTPLIEVAEGDILLTCAGPRSRCGIPCLVRRTRPRLLLSGKMYRFRANSELMLPDFLEGYLLSPEGQESIDKIKTGGSESGLNLTQGRFAALEVPVPPLAEQDRIVEVLEAQLSRLDAALEHVQTLREKAAQFRRSLLHAAFTGALTGHDTSTGELPSGWAVSTVGEACRPVEKVDPAELERPTFLYVDIGSIDNERGVISAAKELAVSEAPTRARQRLKTGDTVFSTVRPYLRNIAWVDEGLDGEIASTGFCVIGPGTAEVHPKFLYYYSVSDQLLDQVLPLQRGVSYPAVRDRDIHAAQLPLPSLSEQEQIVEVLEAQLSRLDAALAVADEVEERAAALRRSLLHAAFTGKLTEKWREENRV